MSKPRSTTSPADQLASTISDLRGRTVALENVAHRHEDMSAFTIPSGIVSPYAGVIAPSGWLLCFGQAISRSTYADLYAVIATTYGIGDGSTTFNLPDLRGRVIAGVDNMGGTLAGRLTSSTITGGAVTNGQTGGNQLQAHTHSGTAQGGDLRTSIGASASDAGSLSYEAAGVLSPPGPANAGAYSFFGLSWTTAARAYNHYTPVYGTTSGASNENNLQPTIVLNYIIKA